MEVHHHAHHQGKKQWKSYIWEFLMLFFAVFCGFLAEWRLEQVIENHREEEYIHSIVEDINADVEQTEKLKVDLNSRVLKLDTLLMALSSDAIQKDSKNAYQLWLSSVGFRDFAQNDRTIQQLKSSGSLRLIRKKSVSDKIMEYDQEVRLLYISQNNLNAIASNNALVVEIFDFIQLNQETNVSVAITENGKKLLNKAYTDRFFWKRSLVSFDKRLASLNKKGKEVAEFIKKQYEIE